MSATFEALKLNLFVGSGFCALSLVAFSAAVEYGFNSQLAPRTWARPKSVLKNVLKSPHLPYGLQWIPWALKLTYKEMLEGIPGTGTRKHGWSGAMLKCNLDDIIVLKFHALCFRVAIFATVLCIAIILPINFTAPCDEDISGETICNNLTSFEQTTLANIQAMHFPEASETVEDDQGKLTVKYITQSIGLYFGSDQTTMARLFGVVLVAWCIYIYACYLVWNEWIDNLAMRRVYYLEHNHYEERKDELDYLAFLQIHEDPLQEERPPHIPHPEMRETVPNVALYSVLYKLPHNLLYTTAKSPNASILDRQLASTVAFFDKCVPNQIGFSSSVAAVTILPDSSQVSYAWKKWYACANRLRRLRFIRSRIRHLQKQEEDKVEMQVAHEQEEESTPFLQAPPKPENGPASQNGKNDLDSSASHSSSKDQGVAEGQGGDTVARVSPRKDGDKRKDDTVTRAAGPRHLDLKALDTVEEHDSGNSEAGTSEHLGEAAISIESPTAVYLENVSDVGGVGSTNSSTRRIASSEEARSMNADNASSSMQSESTIGEGRPAGTRAGIDCPPEGFETFTVPAGESAREKSESIHYSNESSDGKNALPNTMSPDFMSRKRLHFAKFDKEKASQLVGLAEEAKLDMFLSDDGMEQLSVYCREFANSSAGCCPYGCDMSLLRLADLDTLLELEEEAEELVRDANICLIEARAKVNRIDFEHDEDDSLGSSISNQRSRELYILNDELDFLNQREEDEEQIDLESSSTPAENSVIRRHRSSNCGMERQWQLATQIAEGNRHKQNRRTSSKQRRLSSGKWHFGRLRTYVLRKSQASIHRTSRLLKCAASKSGNIVSSVVQNSTYAVVTFTSRQAAIAARQCVADGSGVDRWVNVEDIPVPPLADAPAWNILACRGFCRPVTLSMNGNQKRCRNNVTILFLILFCLLYTIPLSSTTLLLSEERVDKTFPEMKGLSALSGILAGSLYTLFMSICPFIFKGLANFGSGASSIRQAEFRAIRYYWSFILLTAFTGTSLATMVTQGLYSGLNLGSEAQEILRQVAKTIPTQISATQLNWIIVRFLITLPTSYLLQSSTFLFSMLGMKCCARMMAGGGPGGPMPFRIYVDSGLVFLCIVALAPACPLVAPAALMYFIVFSPMLRWLFIFVYRPEYDGGGLRWPLLHDMFISSLIVAQILLTTMMILKKAYGPAALAALSIYPTYLFSHICKDRFLRCYRDAGLLQTSQLDGWDLTKPTSREERDEYRKWLVDCHKASFVPICLAGSDNFLTAEPAVVIPMEQDREDEFEESSIAPQQRTSTFDSNSVSSQSKQRGAMFRRIPSSRSLSGAKEGNVFNSRNSDDILSMQT